MSDRRTGGGFGGGGGPPDDRLIGLNVFSGKNISWAGGVISANIFNLVKPVHAPVAAFERGRDSVCLRS